MKKSHHPQAAPQIDLTPSFEEYPIVEWLTKHAKIIAASLLVAFALLFGLYRWSSRDSVKAETDYFNAAADFQTFQKESGDDSAAQKEALDRLANIMQRRPELHAKYDGLVAQILLNQGDATLAEGFANRTLKRVSDENLPFYQQYAETSLQISQGHYKEALAAANALKLQMTAEIKENPQAKPYGDSLFALNLLRIAILQQFAGSSPQEEKAAWQEWKAYAGWKGTAPKTSGINSKAFYALQSKLQEGSVSLENYIEAREASLKE